MSGWRLALRQAPPLRLDLRAVTPVALAAMSMADVERLPLACGNADAALA